MGELVNLGKERLKRKGTQISRNIADNVLGKDNVVRAYELKNAWEYSNYVKGLSGHPAGEYSITDAIDFGFQEMQNYFSRAIRKKARSLPEKALRKALGNSASGKILDLNFYKNVKQITEDALEGKYKRNVEASDYGELRYKGEVVLGLHMGNSVFYTKGEDTRKALGDKVYEHLLKKTRLTEEKLNRAFESYVITHEIVESRIMEIYGEKELDNKKHGKLEICMLKSLQNSNNSDAEKTFYVAKEIDKLRAYTDSDKWGQTIKEYNDSLPRLERPLETGYKYAHVA